MYTQHVFHYYFALLFRNGFGRENEKIWFTRRTFAREKKEKVYAVYYLKLPEPVREKGPFTGRIRKYMSLLREKLDG